VTVHKKKYSFQNYLILFLGPFALPLAYGDVQFLLREKGTLEPMSLATMYFLPSGTSLTSDDKGGIRLNDLSQIPETDHQIVIQVAGYEKYERAFIRDSLKSLPSVNEIYLEKTSYQVFETKVTSNRDRLDPSRKSLSGNLARSLPGSAGDPVRAVQNLPGVARPQGFSAQVVIQGAAPEDTRYTIDGHEVPIIFHFAGLSSVVVPESIDRIDYLSAGYSPNFGRAVGGLVGVWTKKPERTRTRGFAYVDIFNAGGAIEGPAGEKGSYFFGIRKSYVGTVLKQVAKRNDSLNLTAAPNFDDSTFVYERPLNEKTRFKLVNIASQDTLALVLKDALNDDPNLKGGFSSKTAFFRVIPQFTYNYSDSLTARASLGLGRDWVSFRAGEDYFNLKTKVLTTRADVDYKASERLNSIYGIDHRFALADVSLSLPEFVDLGGVFNPIDDRTRDQVLIKNTASHNYGLYSIQELKLGENTLLRPGLRLDVFDRTKEYLLGPRVSAEQSFSQYEKVSVSSGVYYQPPEERQSSIEGGNPDIRSLRSYHLAIQYKNDFKKSNVDGFDVEAGPFFRYTDRVIETSTKTINRNGESRPEFFNNDGTNRAYGVQSQLKYQRAHFQGWVTYTLLRSQSRNSTRPWNSAEFDQTHNLNLLGAYEFSKNRRLSGRYRYVTGNPFTPVVGSTFDGDQGTFIPTRGGFYSERVTPFWSLDIRYDKKWIYNKWILTFYLDIQNVLNRKNTETVSYSYNYAQRQDIMGLPILPTLGIKGEF